jgi:CheY-like chemotaxis protein
VWKKRGDSVLVEGPDAHARLQPSAEVLEAWQDGDALECIPAQKRSVRVLVVDDYQDAADSLSILVKLWGHEVRSAYDGAAALRVIAAYQPDVLLVDLAMPKMDGCRLARQLRRQTHFKDALLIAITGYADKAHRLLCEEAGFDHFFAKPIELSTLENLLLLEQDRLADTLETSPATPRNCGVLVVDDEAGAHGAFRIGSRHRGLTVWLAAGGAEALEVYRHHRETIDVVLLDLHLPGSDGPRTRAALQALNPQIRCFLSRGCGTHGGERFPNAAAAAGLPKPSRLADVARALWQLESKADPSPCSL